MLGYEWSELKFLLTDEDYVSPLYPGFIKQDFIKVAVSDKQTNETLSRLIEAQGNNTEPI